MPAAFPDCNVAVTLQSCYLVYFREKTLCLLGMAQCCNGMYSGIVWNYLILLCSSTYLLVMHVTILRMLTFEFGTWYIWICTAPCSVQIQMYQVPNINVEILRIMICITRRYVQLQSSTRWFCTIPEHVTLHHLCQLSTYLFVLAIPKLSQVCTSMYSVLCTYLENPKNECT